MRIFENPCFSLHHPRRVYSVCSADRVSGKIRILQNPDFRLIAILEGAWRFTLSNPDSVLLQVFVKTSAQSSIPHSSIATEPAVRCNIFVCELQGRPVPSPASEDDVEPGC